jgi:hypothetical protein
MHQNFIHYPIGTKIESFDSYGNFVLRACGTVAEHLGHGHAIIKDWNGVHWSTVSVTNIIRVSVLV